MNLVRIVAPAFRPAVARTFSSASNIFWHVQASGGGHFPAVTDQELTFPEVDFDQKNV
jgi:hypothetical protein